MIEDLEELSSVVNKNCFMYSAVFKVRFRVQKDNKEASWLYAELKSHISFQVSSVAYLKL